uniref:32 kDa beta-galactoside-binding lectin-like n=1 Tax=Styela clava TaxID=7725 RepID=UPI001939E0B0|nr:32 kDa beta-galactoside-binding lectin-like [Styela clava]
MFLVGRYNKIFLHKFVLKIVKYIINMAMESIENPSSYTALDINGMHLNKVIQVQGVTEDRSDGGYHVNLLCGSRTERGETVALRINPQFAEQQIYRNTKNNNSWGEDEFDGGFPHPSYGFEFNLWIKCRENHFEISFNENEEFITFEHRLPYSKITHIYLGGDCTFKLVRAYMEQQTSEEMIIRHPGLPWEGNMPFEDSMHNQSISFYGLPTEENGRFEFNFMDRDGNIHLHFNPRMSEKEIVRNDYDASTGYFVSDNAQLDLDMPFPFHYNSSFVVKVTEDDYGFQVEINGEKAFHFHHRRENIDDVTILRVEGDVAINKIEFE